MRHRNYSRLVVLIMAVVVITTAIISKYSNRIFTQDSEVVAQDELRTGYGPTLFEPCYTRMDSVCNYETGLLETAGEQGILVSGPNITLSKGRYVLTCTYEIFNPDELVKNDVYILINIKGTHQIYFEDNEESQIKWNGQTLIQNNGKIYFPFYVNQETENINWTFQYKDGIKMGIKSIVLMEQE